MVEKFTIDTRRKSASTLTLWLAQAKACWYWLKHPLTSIKIESYWSEERRIDEEFIPNNFREVITFIGITRKGKIVRTFYGEPKKKNE